MLKKKIEEAKSNKKEFIKNDVIEKIESLAIARRTAHETGWEYEEVDRWITEEAREQFPRFEAKSSGEMAAFLALKCLERIHELTIEEDET